MPPGSWFGSLWLNSRDTIQSLGSHLGAAVRERTPGGPVRALGATERSVSPVVAVVLMAAITIVLATTVGAFVLSPGGSGGGTQAPAPVTAADIERQTANTFATDNVEIVIGHNGGDNVPVSDLKIITETQCFDDDLLKTSTKRGTLTNLPLDGLSGVQSENVKGDDIFQFGGGATEAPLSGGDEKWEAGEKLRFEIDADKCGVPQTAETFVQVIHEPSNSVLVDKTFGKVPFSPEALQDEVEPATAGATATHTWVLDNPDYGTPGKSGDEVDEIKVDYDPNNNGVDADFNGITDADVSVTMTRTLTSGPDRSDITLYSGTYSGSSAKFNTFFFSQTDVAGPISIEVDGIKNPSTPGTYDVEITLLGQGSAPDKTFTKTLEVTN